MQKKMSDLLHGMATSIKPQRRMLVLSLIVLTTTLLLVIVNERIAFLKNAADAYLYGYPLVAMDVTRERSERFLAPKNTIFRMR